MNKKFVLNKKRTLLSKSAFTVLLFTAGQQMYGQEKDSIEVQDLKEVVVTGTKFSLPVEKSGKTIYKLTSEDLERSAGKSVADVLNEVPGIQMDGNFGTPGTNVSYYVRGGRNKNTLILIDGVPLNDPSGIDATFDLRLLPMDQIESIEVLKGGLSTLYGSSASASVINIKLLSKSKAQRTINFNVGSYNSYMASASASGKANKLSYLVNGSINSSQGFSAASDENSTVPFDKDGFFQRNVLVKLGYQFSENFSIDFISGYDNFESEYDDGAFADAENEQLSDQFRVGLSPTFTYEKGKVSLKTLFNRNDREFISSFPSKYTGKNIQADLTHEHQLIDDLKVLWGVNFQNLTFEQEQVSEFDDSKFTIIDPYASVFYSTDYGLNVHAGVRLNTHSDYDMNFLYNVNPSFLFKINDDVKLKLLASVATSYITPSLYQLNSEFYGNQDLEPESSLNYEAGLALYISDKFTLNGSYFIREETNPIDFVSIFDDFGNYIAGQYQNVANDRKVKGFEVDFNYKPISILSISANYANVTTDDITTFYRIPEDKFGATLAVTPFETTQVTLSFNHTGKRTIFDFNSFSELELDNFNQLDVNLQQDILKDKVIVYTSVRNILDDDFIGVYGFNSRGINFTLGGKYRF